MARNSKSKNVEEDKSDWRTRLHNVELSFEEELTIQEWYAATEPKFSLCIEELVSEGWSIRISPPTTGSDFWCSGTYKIDDEDYKGHTWSIRYPDLETSVFLLYWYINNVISETGLGGSKESGGRNWLQK